MTEHTNQRKRLVVPAGQAVSRHTAIMVAEGRQVGADKASTKRYIRAGQPGERSGAVARGG